MISKFAARRATVQKAHLHKAIPVRCSRAVTPRVMAQAAASKFDKPMIYYFPIRGRAEVIKLALSYANVGFDMVKPDSWKGNLDEYLAKKHNMFGNNESEQLAVDMVLEGVESLRLKYVALIYQDRLEHKDDYYNRHVKRSSNDKNGGAHLKYLVHILQKNGTGYMVGSSCTMADLAAWEILDLHMRLFPDQIKTEYPEFVAFYDKIAALPGIKEYLASPQRLQQVNNNNLG